MAEQTQRAFIEFLQIESEDRPLLMVLDDLHWSDAASLRFIDVVLRDIDARSIFVLGFARPEVHTRFPRLWAERGMQELHLGPLSAKASRHLTRAALGNDLADETVERLVKLAEGNAFYLEELIRAAAEGKRALPETVVAMVQARFDGLEADARRVLRAASLYGDFFWSSAVVALLGDTCSQEAMNWLSRLCEQEVVVRKRESRFTGEEEFTFQHALLREAVYAMLTEEDRLLGHRLAGQWLEQHGEGDALTLAEHFERSDERGRAAHYYLRAADHASDADDADAVLSCVERALSCGPVGDQWAALMSLKAGVHLGRAQFAESIASTTEALALLPVESRRWHMTFFTLATATAFSQPGALMDLALRFLDVQPNDEARDEYIRAGVRIQTLLAIMGQKDICLDLLSRLKRESAYVPKTDVSTWGYLRGAETAHYSLIEDRIWSFMLAIEDATVNLDQAGRLQDRCVLASYYGKALMELGDHARAETVLRENLALAERRREVMPLAFARCYFARLLVVTESTDRLSEPEHLALAVIAANNPTLLGLAHGVLAEIALRRNDLETADKEGRLACQAVQPFPPYSWDIVALRVRILLALGRARDAFDAGAEALGLLERLGLAGYGELDLRLCVAEASNAIGRVEDAHDLLRATLSGLRRRVDDIPSTEARTRYLTKVPTHARLLSVAMAWLGDDALRKEGLLVEVP